MKQNLLITGTSDDPFGQSIIQFAHRQFPQITLKTPAQLVDAITAAFFGSNQTRYGPAPSPESQVAIRDVIRHYTSQGRPIPFLVPWGSEKPNGGGIDVAELAAIKTLSRLQDRITSNYEPGAELVIRLEDLSAPYQFFDQADAARKSARIYTDGFVELVEALEMNGFIKARPESTYGITEKQFNDEADKTLETFVYHLRFLHDPMGHEKLKSLGWPKPLPRETYEYYMDAYDKLYPGRSQAEKQHILARYFTSALARKKLKLSGIDPSWDGGNLELYFGKLAPGLSPELYPRRVQYRTIPSGITSNHIAPWRAKGYLKINEAGEATPKLASFNEHLELNPFCLKFCTQTKEVKVQAGYIVAE